MLLKTLTVCDNATNINKNFQSWKMFNNISGLTRPSGNFLSDYQVRKTLGFQQNAVHLRFLLLENFPTFRPGIFLTCGYKSLR